MRGKAGWLILAVGAAACAPTAAPDVYPDAQGMPSDVRRFIIQWQDCNHWLGEEPYDADRARQIERAVRSVCPGVDARGREVRRRHAGDAEVLTRIAAYDPLGL